jgi:hypothetical protein
LGGEGAVVDVRAGADYDSLAEGRLDAVLEEEAP